MSLPYTSKEELTRMLLEGVQTSENEKVIAIAFSDVPQGAIVQGKKSTFFPPQFFAIVAKGLIDHWSFALDKPGSGTAFSFPAGQVALVCTNKDGTFEYFDAGPLFIPRSYFKVVQTSPRKFVVQMTCPSKQKSSLWKKLVAATSQIGEFESAVDDYHLQTTDASDFRSGVNFQTHMTQNITTNAQVVSAKDWYDSNINSLVPPAAMPHAASATRPSAVPSPGSGYPQQLSGLGPSYPPPSPGSANATLSQPGTPLTVEALRAELALHKSAILGAVGDGFETAETRANGRNRDILEAVDDGFETAETRASERHTEQQLALAKYQSENSKSHENTSRYIAQAFPFMAGTATGITTLLDRTAVPAPPALEQSGLGNEEDAKKVENEDEETTVADPVARGTKRAMSDTPSTQKKLMTSGNVKSTPARSNGRPPLPRGTPKSNSRANKPSSLGRTTPSSVHKKRAALQKGDLVGFTTATDKGKVACIVTNEEGSVMENGFYLIQFLEEDGHPTGPVYKKRVGSLKPHE